MSDRIAVPPQIAEIVRSGFVEGHHYGSVVVVGPDGSRLLDIGTTTVPILPRSSNKPLQALAMMGAGLDLPDPLLALAAGSHSGEPMHIKGVEEILASAGLTPDALQTPADYPLDDTAREQVIAAGQGRSPILMNCSGKHAAMLATCVLNGWDTTTYLAPDHPLQRHISDTFAELTGEPVAHVAVDGCGAPLLSASLVGLARAFGHLAVATAGDQRRLADAIRTFPEMTSGSRRDEARLIRAIPGSVAKAGAESVYAVGLSDGTGIAVKVDDGAARVRPVLMTAALDRIGILDRPGVDADVLREIGRVTILGGGAPVGEIRALL